MLYLVKNGIPYDVAWSYEDDERFAAVVRMAEYDGNKYLWTEGRWMTREEMEP